MKKIILAIDNKKIFNKIKEINNFKLIIKNIQYREAILEILKKEKNIDIILINEKLPGEISIEDLINKIKKINKKINIIFFLEKENIKKENKLKKLGIKKIYISNKINKNKILNLLEINEIEKIDKKRKILKNKINNIKKLEKIKNKKIIRNKKTNNKIISIYGKEKLEKNIIINLLIFYLIEKNKKILLINLNKEKNNKEIKSIKKEKNKNLKIINNCSKILENMGEKNNEENLKNLIYKYKNIYDYILIDVGYNVNQSFKYKAAKNSNKKIIVLGDNLLGIQEIKKEMNYKKKTQNNYEESLHIIQNNYKFNSISFLILKNLFRHFCNVHKISYNENYIISDENFSKNRIKKSTKKIIEEILK